jgi:2-iminobutanoate/2-iminopropanoate deaminase
MELISTSRAPGAIGPYSQAIRVGNMIYTAGQVALDPERMVVVGETIEPQTEQVLKNLAEVLAASGSDLKKVVKTTVFLKNFNDFAKMNAIYERAFEGHKPARSTVEVSRLPRDVLVEIECIAVV